MRLKQAIGAPRARRLARRFSRLWRATNRVTSAQQTYSDVELLARADEFNRNAETHWQSIDAEPAGRLHVLNKPFSTVRDTPEILYRLGLLLSALEPGVGQTVLDFGAGSCWLSSCLNRLRCRTISIDISPTALKLGEELFRLDPRHHLDLNPEFLPYDGHRIPLGDSSVDRVACFDAFHHVPNQDEVLGELHRVLKPGGRAVLAEPGEGHAHMDQSLYETAMHGVLENDLDIADVAARARRAGFDKVLLKPYPDAAAMTVTAEEYLRLIDGDRRTFPFQAAQASLRHFYIVILTKAGSFFDSRSPGILAARIQVPEAQRKLSGKAGSQQRFTVNLRNEGDTIWLHELDRAGGYVALGSHLFDAQRRLLRRGFHRTLLPRDVAPGEALDVEVTFTLPDRLGRYVLQLDLVDEYVAWFEQCGSKSCDIEVTVESCRDTPEPGWLAAEIRLLTALTDGNSKPGASLSLSLRLTNLGAGLWLPGAPGEVGAVLVGGHLLDETGTLVAQDFFRTSIARPLAHGATLDVVCPFVAPRLPGRYRLRIDLVEEGVCWFEHVGGAPLEIALETSQETPDSLQPGELRASIEVRDLSQQLEGRSGGFVSVPVRLRNNGNTRWLSSAEPRHGHVALGGHLRDASGALLSLDWFRAPLPQPVAQAELIDLVCQLPLPERSGRYLVELDLVDEGIAWFATHGSQVVTLQLTVTD